MTTPTLDELRRDPTLAGDLPPAAALKVWHDLTVIVMGLGPALTRAVARPREAPPDDEVLTVGEAAALLGIAEKTLRTKARSHFAAALANTGTRHLRFRKLALMKLVQRPG